MPESPPPRAEHRHRGVVRAWLAWWVLLALLWLVLVDSVKAPELLTGVVAATLGATGAIVVRGQRAVLLRPRARWLRGAWRPLLGLVTDVGPLLRALWRRGVLRRDESGALVEVPYAAVEHAGEPSAHRALTEVLGSLAPNTVVVRIDLERRVLVAHQLVPTSDAEAKARPLGEGP